jgi:hypothetical protein
VYTLKITQNKNITVALLLITLVSYSIKTTAQNVGSILKFEKYNLYSEHLTIDTIGYYLMNCDNNEIKIFWNDSVNQKKSNTDIRIVFNKDSLPSVYLGNELFITSKVEDYTYYISQNKYQISKIDVISQIDGHSNRSLFTLVDYGLLIDNSNVWDNHLRFLPLQMEVAFQYSILCDETYMTIF